MQNLRPLHTTCFLKKVTYPHRLGMSMLPLKGAAFKSCQFSQDAQIP